MIKHIVMWKFKSDLTQDEKLSIAKEFERQLHAIIELVDGVESIQVVYDLLDTSNMDIMLDAQYVSKEALQNYQTHPKHVEAASLLKDVVEIRSCVDYEGVIF